MRRDEALDGHLGVTVPGVMLLRDLHRVLFHGPLLAGPLGSPRPHSSFGTTGALVAQEAMVVPGTYGALKSVRIMPIHHTTRSLDLSSRASVVIRKPELEPL